MQSKSHQIDQEEPNPNLDDDESTVSWSTDKRLQIDQEEPKINWSDDESTISESNDALLRASWWEQPLIKYAFNLPSVRANLGRLIGTDEVIVNDYQFMMNLRGSVWNDFGEKLIERVKQRETKEIERTKQLISKYKFNRYNCPKELKPLHSGVLALDLPDESKTVQFSQTAQLPQCNGPAFNINQKTNAAIRFRRNRIRTIRRTNFEYLMRQVLKDVKLSEKLEYDENRAIQRTIKTIHDNEKEKKKLSKND